MFFWLGLLVSACAANAHTPNLNWYTEDYPPFNYEQDGSLKGVAIDILRATYAELNWSLNEDEITIMPWARVYRTLQNQANACVFSITYTKERAQLFNFIGPVMPNTVAIIGHVNSQIDDMQLSTDLSLRFGVVKNDIGHQLLKQYGIPEAQFVYLKTGYELVKMLEHKRVDLIAYGDIIARYQFNRAKINPSQYRVIKPLLHSFLGFACNKLVSADVMEKLDSAIKAAVINNPNLIHYQ